MNKCLLMEVWVSVPPSETPAVSQFCFPQDCSLRQPDFSSISSWSASHLLFYLFQKLHFQFFKNVLLCLGFMFAPHLDFYICVIPSNGESSNPSPVINWCLLGGWEVGHLLNSVLNSQIYKILGHVPHPLAEPSSLSLMQCVYACPLTSRYNIHLVICSTNIQQVYCTSGFGLMKEKTNSCTCKSSPWSSGRDNRYLIQLFRETCKEIITGQSDQWYMTQQSTQSLVLGPKVLALTETNNMHMFRPYPFGPTKSETLSVGQQSVY